ncbi:hypothetical protein BX661DRAFT_189401 [Kickxella alabastrina]|uniref:uncharacterized protein n=1 Tax=Kickxella alabastrina TaxID=61397 RepID=UPI00221F58CF|nr:uncharacterized protein BX661DRAFT_189401 [Kickxella alabastrina]KAI7820218.1 hypothetical protein BX661DRAFT_189401 [Kickxella alabastrina]
MFRVQKLLSQVSLNTPTVGIIGALASGASKYSTKPTLANVSEEVKAARTGVKKAPKSKAVEKETEAVAKPAKKEKNKAKAPTKSELVEKKLNSKKALLKMPPSRAPTAYNLFLIATNKEFRGNNTTYDLGTVTRAIAQKWRTLSESEKQKYQQMSDQERAKLSEEVRAWWSTVDRSQVELENRRRRRINAAPSSPGAAAGRAKLPLLVDPFAPKRPKPAFMVFFAEVRDGLEGSLMEKARAAGAQWKALTEDQKKHYYEIAQDHADQYKKDAERYKARFA